MTQKQNLKLTLIFGLFFISLGGWLLHLRIHSPWNNQVNYLPFIIGILNIAVVPWLFLSRRTLALGYIINGMSVIFGIIMMADFSLGKIPQAFTAKDIILNTTLADILLLIGKFAAGKALFDLEFTDLAKDFPLRSRFARYPNLGWWLIHLVAIAAVYFIGKEVF
ncbi:MAG: hypothetical protein WC980_10275 [Candidatus Brocadiia bacterium]